MKLDPGFIKLGWCFQFISISVKFFSTIPRQSFKDLSKETLPEEVRRFPSVESTQVVFCELNGAMVDFNELSQGIPMVPH